MKMKSLLVGGLSLISAMTAFSQQRACGATEHLERMLIEHPNAQSRMNDIEQFTQQFIQKGAHEKVVVTIPVVVHVVYNTTAQNVSDAQIQSQITVLNNDFRKLNSDASLTPSAFASLAADCEVNFCLASVDPNGAATTGIIRKQTSVTSFTTDDKVKYSAQGGSDAWNSTKYLNLWVCNLGGGLLGYAQFPGSGAAATDGVVIGYTCFGTTGTAAAPFNKGRTATHEVGHWLNLYHIWGDDGTACTGTDNCSDTPNQAGPNYGCPTYPSPTCSNSGDMSMNYMDYVDDACMYMFTTGQKARMQALFASGGARAGLLTSNGCGTATGGGTTPTPTGYCASAGSNVSYEFINKVQIGTISNTSGSNGGYGNFTAQSTNLTKGSSYTMTLTPGFVSTAYSEYFRVYIDWNNDLDFADAGELVYTSPAVTAATSATITVPTTASTAAVRMRVMMKDAALTGPCEAFTYGEVEDYTVNLVTGTTTPPSTCTDAYESNNTTTTAKTISANGSINALIGTSTDVDYFKFTTTSSAPKVRIQLTGLPADYDVILYNASGTQLASSANSGTSSELIKYNTATAGATYLVRVKGYNSAFNASTCYTLTVNSASTNYKEDGTEISAPKELLNGMIVAPNPTSDGKVNIELTEAIEGSYDLMIIDASGRVVLNEKGEKTDASPLIVPANLEQFTNGIYMIRLMNDGMVQTERLILNK